MRRALVRSRPLGRAHPPYPHPCVSTLSSPRILRASYSYSHTTSLLSSTHSSYSSSNTRTTLLRANRLQRSFTTTTTKNVDNKDNKVNKGHKNSEEHTDEAQNTNTEKKDDIVLDWVTWRTHAFACGVPMFGFGLTDNLVMITAGDYIDATLGSTLALSTLTAAGLGQICSDITGVYTGGFVEEVGTRLGVPTAKLTAEEAASGAARRAKTIGQSIGIFFGCLAGMTVLLFMDLDRKETEARTKRLSTIFRTVMDHGRNVVSADRTTLYLINRETNELWSSYHDMTTGGEKIEIKIPLDHGLAGASALTKTLINRTNVYEDERFDRTIDSRTGYKTLSMLTVPVLDPSKDLLGVIQMINKTNDKGEKTVFTTDDEKLVSLMAAHVALFIKAEDQHT